MDRADQSYVRDFHKNDKENVREYIRMRTRLAEERQALKAQKKPRLATEEK